MGSINKVMLVGRVSWDPKLHHTSENKAVCSFGLATNRNWTADSGERHEETEFHRLVAFGKLAEICNQYLTKGRLIAVEGRLHSHSWTDTEGVQRTETEICLDEMQMLDKKLPVEKEEPQQQEEPVQPVSNHQEDQQTATN